MYEFGLKKKSLIFNLPFSHIFHFSDGYFIIGNPMTSATLQDHFALPPGFIDEGAGAIALYKSHNIGSYSPGMAPTIAGLIDIAIYGTRASAANRLMRALLPGQRQIDISKGLSSCCDWTINRCSCCETKQMSNFEIGVPTPLLPNNCSPVAPDALSALSEFIINEIKLSNSSIEFIELKGSINAPLDGHIVVVFTERGRSSYTVSLVETKTDRNGLAVIGAPNLLPPPTVTFSGRSGPVLSEGTGAVVLYRGVVEDFSLGTQMTSDDIVDAIVFTNDQTKLDNELKTVLTPDSPSFYADNSW